MRFTTAQARLRISDRNQGSSFNRVLVCSPASGSPRYRSRACYAALNFKPYSTAAAEPPPPPEYKWVPTSSWRYRKSNDRSLQRQGLNTEALHWLRLKLHMWRWTGLQGLQDLRVSTSYASKMVECPRHTYMASVVFKLRAEG